MESACQNEGRICIVVFEGLPGAGKTSLIAELAARIHGSRVLPEFMPRVSGDRDGIRYYLENERLKWQAMDAVGGSVILVDRFWHSTLVYKGVGLNAQTVSDLLLLKQILYKEHFTVCYHYVYLALSPAISLLRSGTPSFPTEWVKPSFLQCASELYDLIYKRMHLVDPNVLGTLRIDASKLSALSATEVVLRFLHSQHPAGVLVST